MITLPNYRTLERLHTSSHSLVYRGEQESTRVPVILKVLNKSYPTPTELAHFQREYEVTRQLALEGVVQVLALEQYQSSLVIVFEDIGGASLRHHLQHHSFSVEEMIELAIRFSEILGAIHTQRVIHKDLNPANIILNRATGRVQVIDFSIATLLAREKAAVRNPDVLEGTLPYLSPEQTGRMNRAVDYRSDFYSLGATLYELLTGQPPFQAQDAVELVHAHLARAARAPHELNPLIPPALSAIVLKLLAKTAEERYQSARGLQVDLEAVLRQLRGEEQLDPFAPGRHDRSPLFQLPQKLYGRETERAILLAAFERVSRGATELLLVSGYSGIGKTALIQEVQRPLVRERGYFITGKFDQFQRNTPYAGLIEAFRDLLRQLLTESDAQLAAWREKLLAALGGNGQIIVDVLPRLEAIIGPQPQVAALAPQEAQYRFNQLFRHFINVFAQKVHPLVLFLDDLQWADAASLGLLQVLMTDPASHHLLLIGACRDNEVSSGHPLMLAVDEIRKVRAALTTIVLYPLGLAHVTHLIQDTVHRSAGVVRPLAELVLAKTAGNPFFIDQFLLALHRDGLLTFDAVRGEWQWELRAIQAVAITDNVVELMAAKIRQLSPRTQHILQVAACIGNRFDSQVLGIMDQNQSPAEIAAALWEPLQEGLIVPLEDSYRLLAHYHPEDTPGVSVAEGLVVSYQFLHDRIQQAAYSLIAEEERPRLHLELGRLMRAAWEAQPEVHTLFDVVNHLNLGAALISEEVERYELARLNQAAGEKAKHAAAFEAAAGYFERGALILGKGGWSEQYDLALALHKAWAECTYLCGDFTRAEALLDLILERVQRALERADLYAIRLGVYNAQTRSMEALALGLQALALLGMEVPENPTPDDLVAEAASIEQNLGGRRIAELRDAPAMTDRVMLTITSLMSSTCPPAYQIRPLLFVLLSMKQVNLALLNGNATSSPDAYAMYGLGLTMQNDYQRAYEYSKLAVELVEKTNNLALKGRAYYSFAVLSRPWARSFKGGGSLYDKALQGLLEVGDFIFLGYHVLNLMRVKLAQGTPLPELHEEMVKLFELIKPTNYKLIIRLCQSNNQFLRNLLGLTHGLETLDGDDFREADHLEAFYEIEPHDYYFWVHKVHSLYLHERYEAAHRTALEAHKSFGSNVATLAIADHYFYHALTLTALYPEASDADRAAYRERLASYDEQHRIWADHCPENFLNRLLLLQAEVARIEERPHDAAELYDQAIQSAHDNDLMHIEALANELAARFYLARGKVKIARAYLTDARYGYLRWGARPKVRLLEQRYSELLQGIPLQGAGESHYLAQSSTSTSTTGTGSLLDLATVMKAAQTLSGEIDLDRLLAKLMTIVLENAGAQRAALLLERAGHLVVEAEGDIYQEQVRVLQGIPVEESGVLCAAIVHYAARTLRDVVLNDATQEGLFVGDPYVMAQQLHSVLCTPLLHQGRLMGVLYLENRLARGVFTPERVDMVQLLGTQAAISITNAQAIAARAEQERIRLEKQLLEQRAQDLAELNASKDKFFSIISHDLRSPFNSLLGLTHLMQRDGATMKPEEIQRFSERVHSAGKTVLTLLDNLLEWSQMQTGRMAFQPEEVDLSEVVQRNLLLLGDMAASKGIALISEVAQGTLVYADANMIDTVFRNLISNALKFTRAGGRVAVIPTHEGGWVEVSVSDTGVGINREHLQKLFRLDTTHSTAGTASEKGTGLGLILCKELVEKNRGRIWVESAPGEGTTFKFTLPASAPPGEAGS